MRFVMFASLGLGLVCGCAKPGSLDERVGFVARPRDACALPEVAADFIFWLNQRVAQPGGPPSPVLSIQRIASPAMIIEQRSDLRSCRAVLAFDNGQTASGTLTILEFHGGAIRKASWESDLAAEKRVADEQRATIETQRIVDANRAADLITPIENDAVLYEDSKDFRAFTRKLAMTVKDFGFTCKSISAARPMVISTGYVLACNEFRYTYNIQDNGGRWTVAVR